MRTRLERMGWDGMREQRSDDQGRDDLLGIISKVIETLNVQGCLAMRPTGYSLSV